MKASLLLTRHICIRMQQRGIPFTVLENQLLVPADLQRRVSICGITLALLMLLVTSTAGADEYLGQLSADPYDSDSTSNPYGQHGSEYAPDSINNDYGRYGSRYSNQGVSNPYATDTPKLYDSEGNYRGKLSSNRYDPDSVSNPYGRYGSPYSPDSINNPYGAGSPYRSDSPNNPYGDGLSIYGDEEE